MMKNVLISGGSGLVGTALTNLLLEKGYRVAHLSTRKNYQRDGVSVFHWNPSKGIIDPKAFEHAEVLVHLAGAGIADKRWSDERKQLIIDSRVQSAKVLTDFLNKEAHQVQRFIGASAIGYYGDSKETLTEDSPLGKGFLAEVCALWEASYDEVPAKIATAILRLGVVLSAKGGALPEMMKTSPFFIGVLGSGKQTYSWIHIEDLARMFVHLIENDQLKGTYNAVAPQRHSQMSMAKLIANIKGIPTVPTPEFALNLALGEMKEVVLNSQNCSAKKIINAGFHFKYENLEEALKEILD